MNWLTKLSEARAADRYDRGFEFAAGQLLRGTPVDVVDELFEESTQTEFNTGMHDAVRRYEKLIATPKYYCQNCRCGDCGNTFPKDDTGLVGIPTFPPPGPTWIKS